MGCLHGAAPDAHLCYLGRRTRFPIRPPTTPDKSYHIFAKIQWEIPRPLRQEIHCQAWISPETWSLIGNRIESRQQKDQWSSWALGRSIKAGLQGGRRRQADELGSAVESLLTSDPSLILESWIRMRGWYKAAVDRPPPPDRVALDTMTAEREELYRNDPPPGEPIPVGDLPF